MKRKDEVGSNKMKAHEKTLFAIIRRRGEKGREKGECGLSDTNSCGPQKE
jgi:hypothetical protein